MLPTVAVIANRLFDPLVSVLPDAATSNCKLIKDTSYQRRRSVCPWKRHKVHLFGSPFP